MTNREFICTELVTIGHEQVYGPIPLVDDMGRTNILWVANRQIGAQFDHGKFVLPEDSIKMVLYSDPQRIHAYPVSSTGFSTGTCEVCGEPIVTS